MTVAYPRAGVHLTLGQDRLGRLADALGTRLFDSVLSRVPAAAPGAGALEEIPWR
jgi:hypothetical protein